MLMTVTMHRDGEDQDGGVDKGDEDVKERKDGDGVGGSQVRCFCFLTG